MRLYDTMQNIFVGAETERSQLTVYNQISLFANKYGRQTEYKNKRSSCAN